LDLIRVNSCKSVDELNSYFLLKLISQNPFPFNLTKHCFPMPKSFFFLLFTLLILRGEQIIAQNCKDLRYTFNYVACETPGTFSVSYYNVGSAVYTFRLDGVVSTTNTWQNITNGWHELGYSSDSGCFGVDSFIYLRPQPLYLDFQQQPRVTCRDTSGTYKMVVIGGQAPYTFSVNRGATTTNNIVALNNGRHHFKVTDVNGCRNDSINANYSVYFRSDTVSSRTTFVPRTPCDSLGTLTVSVNDQSLMRPLSFSFHGSGKPFTTDSALKLVHYRYDRRLNIRTADGCLYDTYINTNYSLPENASFAFNYTSCGSPAQFSLTPGYGTEGIQVSLDSVFSPTNTWQNVSPGAHRLILTNSNGCKQTWPINLVAKPLEVKAEQANSLACNNSMRLVKLTGQHGRAPYTFKVDNGATTMDSLTYISQGGHNITIKDASGCVSENVYTNIAYRRDSVPTMTTFTLNNGSTTLGTLRLSILDNTVARPLSISLNGRPFTTDSVFTNISSTFHDYVVQSAQGCLYYGRSFVEPKKCDTLRPRYTVNYPLYCNASSATVTITYPPIQGVSFTFRLDGAASATNSWQNITAGTHTLGYSASNGCNWMDTTITLVSSPLQFVAEQQPVTNCADSLFTYKLTPLGGQPPYRFSVNEGTLTSNNIVRLPRGGYSITVIDAVGCRTQNGYLNVFPRLDSVKNRNSFVANGRCGDTIGTVTISVLDSRVTRPFTISLAGRPYTSDTIFRNVNNGYGSLPFTVKSAEGCLYYGSTSYYYPNTLQVFTSDSCANRLGRGAINAFATGGTPPYRFSWNNGSINQRIENVPIGIYTVFVFDRNDCPATKEQTLTTCVWAGDTDTSGVVNASDLLNIGLAFGQTGQQRLYCETDTIFGGFCSNWGPFNAPFWSKQTPSSVNYKHIDATGNGVINHADTLVVIKNWSKTRTLRGDNPVSLRGAAPPILVQTGRIAEGQWAAFPIILGDAANTAKDVYGLAFSINYDPSVIDAASVYLSFGQNWLGNGDNVLRIFKNFNGTIEAAISRTNQQNGSGIGQIATLNFKTKAGMSGRNLVFSVDNQQVINKDAQPVPTTGQTTSTTVLTSTAEPDWAHQIAVYPNPTMGKVIVESQNLDVKSVEVFDISGKSLFKTENIEKNTPLSIEHAGTYFLKIQTENGVAMRKLVRL
jgi:Secretion system C-terminal sorting domain/SprB repeat